MKVAAIIICCLASVSPVAFADEDINEKLLKQGVRVSAGSAMLAAETELNAGLRDVTKLRRDLVSATKAYEDFKSQQRTLNEQITRINQQSNQLNAQLANVRTVVQNNRLVGAINAVEGQLRMAYEKRRKMDDQEKAAHGAVSNARDAFISHILSLGELADQIAAGYESPSSEVSELLAEYNKVAGAELKLEPTRSFAANVRTLEKMEEDVLSEDIPLRREGNTYWATATVNGDRSVELVVDSGASLITLPFDVAANLGLTPGPNDPEIELVVADGRTISGRLMTLQSVRVGKFQVGDVECAVLGPEATNAAPLLGMTFLGQFKFQLDGGKSTLSITQYDSDDLRPRPPRGA